MDGTGTLLQSGSASELSITFVASLGGKKRKIDQGFKGSRVLWTATKTDSETGRGDCRFFRGTLKIEKSLISKMKDICFEAEIRDFWMQKIYLFGEKEIGLVCIGMLFCSIIPNDYA